MAIHEQTASFDVVVVGGGFSGVCAAIAAAREGAKVALVQNRPVFGGSGSSETRMHIVGANCHSSKPNLRETGILEEILLENKRRNPYADFPVFDTIVWEKVRMEPNITILLNTNIDDVVLDGDRILAVTGCQNTTETRWTVYGKIFIDATGHGTVGVMAGAESRIGSESKHEFNEPTAPEEANNNKMGNTIMFTAIDRGEPVTFIKPVWANTYSEEDLKYRPHVDRVCAQADGGGLVSVDAAKNQLPEFSNVDAGYWWIELGGDAEDIIQESEQIHEDLLKVLYGVWDHIKNQADHGAQNLDLNWVSTVPGCRESRRLVGDYLLNENDVRANRVFDDAVAYGGWRWMSMCRAARRIWQALAPASITSRAIIPSHTAAITAITSKTSCWPAAISAPPKWPSRPPASWVPAPSAVRPRARLPRWPSATGATRAR